jgi:hypothetical protein
VVEEHEVEMSVSEPPDEEAEPPTEGAQMPEDAEVHGAEVQSPTEGAEMPVDVAATSLEDAEVPGAVAQSPTEDAEMPVDVAATSLEDAEPPVEEAESPTEDAEVRTETVERVATGHDEIDAAMRRLDELDALPVDQHGEILDELHGRLRDALAAAASPPSGRSDD